MDLHGVRARTAAILDVSINGDRVSRIVDYFLICLIIVNVVAVILESVEEIHARWAYTFYLIERVSLLIFSIEYVLRVWSIVDNSYRPKYAHRLWGRLKFMRSPMAIIDLVAIAPFWLSLIFPMDLRFLRVVRLLRVLKLTRYSAAMNLLFDVLREEARVIGAAMFTVFILVILTASATYLAENATQPEVFSNIPQAMWWAVVTVTTVGYGDMVPVTPFGKFLGSLLGFIGVAMVALPAGIMASGFSNALHRRRNNLRREVDLALKDGVIDRYESELLKSHAQSLSLSDADMNEILHEHAASGHPADSRVCPHCGHSLQDRSDRHAA
ncbi:MAG: ion transporter [Gammaproteobacteria bacterium]|nr:ion transporter [Gammaproteobacteria bacterium]